MTFSIEQFMEAEQSYLDESLLKRGFGGKPHITKKGRDLVKFAAPLDEEVADALREVLRSRWRDRRAELVTLMIFVRSRVRNAEDSVVHRMGEDDFGEVHEALEQGKHVVFQFPTKSKDAKRGRRVRLACAACQAPAVQAARGRCYWPRSYAWFRSTGAQNGARLALWVNRKSSVM
jgi:hypothetical protein